MAWERPKHFGEDFVPVTSEIIKEYPAAKLGAGDGGNGMAPVIKEIALDNLITSPLNVRKDQGDIEGLIASISNMGVLEPILVLRNGDKYETIAGSLRAEAARRAGQTAIPAIVLEVTDAQAIRISLVENIQRKRLTLVERVEGYKALQEFDPMYSNQSVLANDTGQSPQKITQDFQAYEMLLRLAPHGITVSSDLMPTDKRRQQGVALPEYHAVLVHQAMSALAAEGAVTEAETEERMVELAHLIAPMSQEAAKKLMEQVKAGDQPARHSLHHIAEELVPFRQRNAGRHGASRPKKSSFKRRENGGLVTCSCCNRILQLAHLENGTHHVSDTPFMRQPQLPAPVFSPEPGAAALPPAPAASDAAPALSAMGTPEPILKMTAGYTLDAFPKGLGAVLTLHNSGFWGKLGRHPARPDFKATDIPQSIWTLDPWLGCVYGTSCRFCYVPTLCARIYPDGKQSYWYQQWGNWLIYKPDITNRLRRQLMDGAGHTRPAYQGAAVYMSPKTDPLVPITDALAITAQNLDVFLDADIFLMIQTRSKAVAESDPDIFNRIVELGRRKKVGISFSISTDLLDQQRRIESGGLLPDERLRIMARLKQAGLFVSAAVAPLMPYSPDFARKLVESCHHASIQVLHLIGSGAATPKPLLTQMHKEIPHYRELERKLAEEIEAVDGTAEFSWGINNKGFIGAFLAAHRFYKTG